VHPRGAAAPALELNASANAQRRGRGVWSLRRGGCALLPLREVPEGEGEEEEGEGKGVEGRQGTTVGAQATTARR